MYKVYTHPWCSRGITSDVISNLVANANRNQSNHSLPVCIHNAAASVICDCEDCEVQILCLVCPADIGWGNRTDAPQGWGQMPLASIGFCSSSAIGKLRKLGGALLWMIFSGIYFNCVACLCCIGTLSWSWKVSVDGFVLCCEAGIFNYVVWGWMEVCQINWILSEFAASSLIAQLEKFPYHANTFHSMWNIKYLIYRNEISLFVKKENEWKSGGVIKKVIRPVIACVFGCNICLTKLTYRVQFLWVFWVRFLIGA